MQLHSEQYDVPILEFLQIGSGHAMLLKGKRSCKANPDMCPVVLFWMEASVQQSSCSCHRSRSSSRGKGGCVASAVVACAAATLAAIALGRKDSCSSNSSSRRRGM
jgi:hypothetical protein